MVLDLTVWYYFSLGESFSSSEPEGILKMFLKFQQSCVKFYDKLGFYKIKVYCTVPLSVISVNFMSVMYYVLYDYINIFIIGYVLI